MLKRKILTNFGRLRLCQYPNRRGVAVIFVTMAFDW